MPKHRQILGLWFRNVELEGGFSVRRRADQGVSDLALPTRHVIHKGCEEYSMFKKEHVHVDVGIYG